MQEGKWLARLSDSKLDDFKQLREKMGPVQRAFDNLLPITGLWGLKVKLGSLHRVLLIKCPEVTMV